MLCDACDFVEAGRAAKAALPRFVMLLLLLLSLSLLLTL